MNGLKLILARIVFWTGCVIGACWIFLMLFAIGVQVYECFKLYPSTLKVFLDIAKAIIFMAFAIGLTVIWGLCGSYIDERKKK